MQPDRRRVLLISSDPEAVLQVRRAMAKVSGVTLMRTPAGLLSEGLRRLARNNVGAVLLDLDLPDIHGLDALRSIREAFPQIPVLALSSRSEAITPLDVINLGAQDYFAKEEFNGPVLGRAVRYAIERKQAESAARGGAELFRNVYQEAPIGITLTSRDGTFVSVNPAFCRMLGYTVEEITRMTFLDVTHLDDRDTSSLNVEAMWQGKIPSYRAEKRYIAKNGETRWGGLSTSLIRGGDGTPLYAIAMVEDITQRRQAEALLQLGEERYKLMFDSAPLAISITRGTEISYANPRYLHMFGYADLDELRRCTPAELFAAESRPQVLESIERRAQGLPVPDSYEAECLRKDGTPFPALLHLTRTMFADGPATVAFVMDMTERKQAEMALRQSEEKFRLLSERSQVGIYIIQDGRMAYVNPAFADMFGYAPEAIMAMPNPEDLIRPADVEAVRGRLDAELRGENASEAGRFSGTRKDGSLVDIQAWGAMINYQGRPAVLGTAMDVTERRRAEILQDAVYRLGSATLTTASLNDLYAEIHRVISRVMNAENFYIALYDEERDLLSFPYFRDQADEAFADEIHPEKGLTAYVLRTGKSLLCTQAVHDELERQGEVKLLGAPSCIWLGVPLCVQGKTIGAVVVQHYSDPAAYGEREQQMLEFVSAQVAVAIERKRAEEALRESEGNLRLAEGIAHVGYWSRNVVTGEILWSDEAYRIFGLQPQATPLHIATLPDHIHPDDRQLVKHALDEALAGRQPYDLEYRALRPDGTARWVHSQAKISLNGRHEPVRMFGTVIDITERKQAERLQDAIYRIAQAADQTESLEALYPAIHTIIRETMVADNFYIALYDEQSDMLSFPYFVDAMEASAPATKPGKGLTEYVLRSGRPLLCDDALFEKLVQGGQVEPVGAASPIWLGVPLIVDGKTLGVIAVQDYENAQAYSEREQHVLEFVSSQAAKAIQRKRADEAILRAEEKYRSIFENATEAITQTTPEGRYLTANPAAARTLGYETPADLIREATDLTGHFYVKPGRREEFMSLMEREGSVSDFESEVYRRDGSTRWISENSHSIRDEDGRTLYYEGTAQDITERKRTEQALRIAEDKFRTMVEQTSAIIYLVQRGRNAPVTYISPQVERVLGFTPEEWISKPGLWEQLLHPADRDRVLAESDLADRTGEPFRSEYRIYAKDGRVVWLYDESKTVLDEHGQVLYSQGSEIDITERKQAEQALQQRARELQLLYETSLEVSAQTSLDKLLLAIVERAASLVGTDGGSLYLMEPDGDSLTLHVGHNLPPTHIGTRLKLGEGISGAVAQTGKVMQVDDYQVWPGRAKIYDRTPFRRVLGVPLKVKDKMIGVINVSDFRLPGSFSEDQIRLASLFADQAALAIEAARLYQEERSRSAELTTLYESTMAMSSNLALDVVLRTVVEQVTKALRTDECTVSFVDGARDAVVTMLDFAPTAPEVLSAPGTLYFLKDYPTTRRVLESRQPFQLSRNSPESDATETSLLEKIGMGTVLMVPLVARGQVSGLMELYWREQRRTTTNDELHLAVSLSAQIAVYLENSRLFERSERRLARTLALHRIDQAVTGSTDVSLILQVILDQALPQLGAAAAAILLYDPITQGLNYASGAGFRTESLRHTQLAMGQGYAGRAAMARRMVHVPDLRSRHTDFLRSPSFSQEGFVSYTAVPLIAKGEIKGVLEVFHRAPLEPDSEWQSFLETLAGQAATAVDSATMFEDLQRANDQLTLAYDATIEGWSRAMDLRDRETEGHSQRVAEMTVQLARRLGLPDQNLLHVRRGALLHDIGKMGVPDEILQKVGPLTDVEWMVMKRHPVMAYEMLAHIRYLEPALEIPYCHHEKWDGSGYPRGLQGDRIPLAARVFAVVDVYDALTAKRPYRPPWTSEQALEYIRSQSGKHFEPAAAEAFLDMVVLQTDGPAQGAAGSSRLLRRVL